MLFDLAARHLRPFLLASVLHAAGLPVACTMSRGDFRSSRLGFSVAVDARLPAHKMPLAALCRHVLAAVPGGPPEARPGLRRRCRLHMAAIPASRSMRA
jgi:hypothetical protein